MKTLISIALLLTSAGAQVRWADVHFIRIQHEPEDLPEVSVAAVERYRWRDLLKPESVGGVGRHGLKFFSLQGRPDAPEFTIRGRRFSSQFSGSPLKPGGQLLQSFEYHFGGERRYFWIEGSTDEPAAPPEIGAGSEIVQAVAESVALQIEEGRQPDSAAWEFLSSLPLATTLDPRLRLRLSAALMKEYPASRRTHDGMPADPVAEMLLALANPAGLHRSPTPSTEALSLAFLQSNSPEEKGQFAWALMDLRNGAHGPAARLVPKIARAIKRGEATLPAADETERRSRNEMVFALADQQDPFAPLMVILAAGAIMAGFVTLIHRAGLRAIT